MARKPFTLRKTLALVAALLVIGTIVWWTNRDPREPVYQGKKLSWWLIDNRDPRTSSPRLSANEIKSLGPEAVEWLGFKAAQTSIWDVDEGAGVGWLQRLRWRVRQRWFNQPYWEFTQLRSDAADLLGYLGPDGAPAIPSLVRALRISDQDGRLVAADSLLRMGPVSWPAVRDTIKNGDPWTSGLLVYKLDGRWAYERMQDDPQEFAETVALLVPRTFHEDRYTHETAVRQLKACGTAWQAQPRVSEGLALVAGSLARGPEPVTRATARFLASFGEQAATAIPALTALAEVPDELTRGEVLGALSLIEPNNSRWPDQLRKLAASPNKEVAKTAEGALIRAGK